MPALVEILYVESCPNHEPARLMVERVCRSLGVDADIRDVKVADEEAARRLRFLGSPSIHVAGEDVEPPAASSGPYGIACRVYRTESGPANVPSERSLRLALERAVTR